VLQGTFETLALPELLGLLASARKSGALRLEAGPVSGIVHLEDGHCLAVETKEHAGAVQDGPALLTRLVDVCFAVIRQESGAFRFASDEPAPWRSDEPAELSDALVEVDRLLKQWREILQVIPSLDCRPHLLDGMGVDEIIVDRTLWAVIVKVDGHRSVRDLVALGDRPVIDVCHSLLELVEAGALEVLDPADVPTPVAPPAPAGVAPAPAPVAPAPAPVAPAPVPAASPAPAPTAPPKQPEPAKAEPAKAEPAKPEPEKPGARPAEARPAEARPAQPRPAEPQPEPQRQPVTVPAGDDPGDHRDKGAFLRLFSGLRDD
jgi:hypothetical protein